MLETTYPEAGSRTLSNWEGQVWAFLSTIQPGDIIALPLKGRPNVAFGKVAGPYLFDPTGPSDAVHQRQVESWTEIPRASIPSDVLMSFGALMTVCRVQKNNAESRIQKILEGKTEETGLPSAAVDSSDAGTDTADQVPYDFEAGIREQIRQRIIERFNGHELAELTAAVLECHGFAITVSSPGPDGGVDIIAAKGLFGFDPPKMVVQVKSSSSPIDVMAVRQLQGVMHQHSADHGLFVAWGGYRSSVQKEFSRYSFQMKLWTGEDLIDAVLENYDQLPASIRNELPLKRVWMLSQTDALS